MDTITTFFSAMPAWVSALTGVISSATVLTMMTPSRTDDQICQFLLKILNWLAGNWGHNKNADDK